MPAAAQRKAADWLLKRGVRVHYNSKRSVADISQTASQSHTHPPASQQQHEEHSARIPYSLTSCTADVCRSVGRPLPGLSLSPRLSMLCVALTCVVMWCSVCAERDSGPSSFVFDCCGLLPVPCPAAAPANSAAAAAAGGGEQLWQRDGRGCFLVNSAQQLLLSSSSSSSSSSSQPSAAAAAASPPPAARHMYAIGDCCSCPVPSAKLAYSAELQAVVAANNVARQMHSGAESQSLLAYPLSLSGVLPAPILVCCSLGAWDGVLVFNDLVVGGWLAALAKHVIERSKVGQYRGDLASVALWTVGEPMTFAINHLYHAVIRTWRVFSQRHASEQMPVC